MMIRVLSPVLVMVLVLTGCASPPPEDTALKFLDAVRAVNIEDMTACVVFEGGAEFADDLMPEDPESVQMLTMVLGKITYEVGKSTVDGDTATVPVSVTCIDMTTVLMEVMSKAMGMALAMAFGEEQAEEDVRALVEQMVASAVSDPETPMSTQDISIPMRKSEGKWLIVWNEETADAFLNAITGNLGKVFEGMAQ